MLVVIVRLSRLLCCIVILFHFQVVVLGFSITSLLFLSSHILQLSERSVQSYKLSTIVIYDSVLS